MGIDEGIVDVEMKMENCPITIPPTVPHQPG